MDTELVEGSEVRAEGSETRAEGSLKRAGDELEQENEKKKKVDDDKEIEELKSLMEVIPDEEEVALDAIPLAVKSPSIIDWKIHKERKKNYYQIIRADGSSKIFVHSVCSKESRKEEKVYLGKIRFSLIFSSQGVIHKGGDVFSSLRIPQGTHVEESLSTRCKSEQGGSEENQLTTLTRQDDEKMRGGRTPHSANVVPLVHRMTARISIRDEPSISLPPREEEPSLNCTAHVEGSIKVTDLATIVRRNLQHLEDTDIDVKFLEQHGPLKVRHTDAPERLKNGTKRKTGGNEVKKVYWMHGQHCATKMAKESYTSERLPEALSPRQIQHWVIRGALLNVRAHGSFQEGLPKIEELQQQGNQRGKCQKKALQAKDLEIAKKKIIRQVTKLISRSSRIVHLPIMGIAEGKRRFHPYCDASKRFGAVLMQKRKGSICFELSVTCFTDHKSYNTFLIKELNIRQRRMVKWLVITIAKFVIPTGKANVVADALSRKEREPPLRVRALFMTIGLNLPKQILKAQTEA
ncbi:hypothetical protein Tco_0272715 [Tanacetum coccineum]